jgi:hypothetical protein
MMMTEGRRDYSFVLSGFMPLIMHADSIDGSDELQEWRKNPANKGVTVPGDDRSPGWTWQTYLYTDGTYVTMPADNVMVALRQAGAQLILKKQKTFKEATQSGLVIPSEHCDFYADKNQVEISAIRELRDLPYAQQAAAVKAMGFELFAKRAKVGTSKHIRVRPRFKAWRVEGTITANRPEITEEVLAQLFDLAGTCGLCDWRPAGKTPGPYGQFKSSVKAL